MTLEFFLIIFLAIHFRKSLRASKISTKWDRILTGLIIISIALLVSEILDIPDGSAVKWIAHLFMFFMAYLALKEEAFKPVRTIMYHVLPFILVSFLKDLTELVSKSFYSRWE